MDNLNIPAWVGKAVYAVSVAALLGGTTTLVENTRDVAVLQSRQDSADERDENMERQLTQRLDRMEGMIDVLIEKGHSHP